MAASAFKSPEWTALEDMLVSDRFRKNRRDTEIAAELCSLGRPRTWKAVEARRKVLDLRRSSVAGPVEDFERIWWAKAKKSDAAFQRRMMRYHPELQGTVTSPSTDRPRALMPAYVGRSASGWSLPPSPDLYWLDK